MTRREVLLDEDVAFIERAAIEIYTHGEVDEDEAFEAAFALWQARRKFLGSPANET